jgi:hypothetical protein
MLLGRLGRHQDATRYYQNVKSAVEKEGYSLSPSFEALLEQIQAQSRLLPTLREIQVRPRVPETVYVGLEMDILALAWRWQPFFGSLALLQELFYDRIRKHDMMHNSLTRRQALQAIAMFPLQAQGIQLSMETVLLPSHDMLPLCAAGLSACWELRQYEAEGMQMIQLFRAA